MNKEIVSYNPTKAALADLVARYKSIVYDVATPQGMADAKRDYKIINTHSLTLEAARVKEKADSLAYSRFVDSEAKAIADPLDELRLPIKAQIETQTKKEEREQAAKVEAERLRILAEQEAAKKAEEERMAAARAEIKRQQDELAKAAAARAQADLEARLKIELDQRVARATIEAEERAARAAREEADRVHRQALEAQAAKDKAVRDAEEARLKAVRDKLYAEAKAIEERKRAEQEAIEAKAKAIRDAEEAKQREIERQKNELLDAHAALESFIKRFGHRHEFAELVEAMRPYVEAKKAV